MAEDKVNSPLKYETADSKTQDQILRAALKEFAECGIEGARVDRIAKKAGINKAMIYYYFSSKENLYTEVLRCSLSDIVSTIDKKTSELNTFENTLRVFGDTYQAMFLTRPEILKLFLRELADPNSTLIPKLAQIVSESGLPERLRHHITEGISNKQLRTVDVRQTIVSFITLNLGYFLLAPMVDHVLGIDDREQFIIERKQAIVDLFLNGVIAR